MAVQRFKIDTAYRNNLNDYKFKGDNIEMNYQLILDTSLHPLTSEYIYDGINHEKLLWSSSKIRSEIDLAIGGGATGISNHDSSGTAHLDIRILISNLVCDNSNVNLSPTTHLNLKGTIQKQGALFIHDFNYGDNGTVITQGHNLFCGVSSGSTSSGATATQIYHSSNNTGIGFGVCNEMTTGYSNTGVGSESISSTTSGKGNVGVGMRSLYSNLTGNYNVAIGLNSMNYNTAGEYNVAMGSLSLYNNLIGNRNIAIGSESLYNCNSDLNVAIGGESLYHCAEYSNVGVGFQSGRYYKDGGSFTALSNVRWSLFIGNYTMSGAPTGTTENEIVIGFQTVGNGSNTVTLGNDDITKTYLKGDVHTESGIKFGNVTEDGYMKVGSASIEFYFDGAWHSLALT